jgi:hypothetical protein
MMEQPVFGYDKDHNWIQVCPKPPETAVYRVQWAAR